jgi:hypothetical protein
MNPQVNMLIWEPWLTEQRIHQFNQIPGMEDK